MKLAFLFTAQDIFALPGKHPRLVWGLVLVAVVLTVVVQIMNALTRAFKACPGCHQIMPLGASTCRRCHHAFTAADNVSLAAAKRQ